MNKIFLIIILAIHVALSSFAQTYPNNEDGQYEDMLTPEYYHTPIGGAFRLEVNKFIHFTRQLPFQHPLQDPSGHIPTHTVNRNFGDGIGPGGTGSHHPASDIHIGGSSLVNFYAVHDGYVSISRDIARYRHYLSITKDIKDSLGINIGKIVTLYAHIDLDLDSIAGIDLEGQYVNKGELVSKHLYTGTVGGPHLHFEIRYYRPTDTGLEGFYGGNTPDNTEPSSGSWTYGYWNPNYGYGFGNPENHLNQAPTSILYNDSGIDIKCYPNPVKRTITFEIDHHYHQIICSIYTVDGQLINKAKVKHNDKVQLNLDELSSGIYFLHVLEPEHQKVFTKRIIKE